MFSSLACSRVNPARTPFRPTPHQPRQVPRRNISWIYNITPYPPEVVNAALSMGSLAIGAVGATALGKEIINRYKVAGPDEMIIRTGLFIDDIAVSKRAFVWPFQKYKFIKMHPHNYSFRLQSMSNEKIPFELPAVFTIGPDSEQEALVKYARLLENVGSEKGVSTIDSVVLGVLEGETRTMSSQMTMEQIFNDREAITKNITKKIQAELKQFGLKVYNANIKELEDSPQSKYFHNMRQKKLSEAENQAKVHVSEAVKTGDIGKKEREATTRQQVAQLEADTILRENERLQEVEKSTAALAIVKAEANRARDIANIEAKKAAEMRDTDLQRELEQKRITMETEKGRARDAVKAQVQAEARVKDAEGAAQSRIKEAEGSAQSRIKEAEGSAQAAIKDAEGAAQATRLHADANLYAKRAEAEGIQAILDAEAKGLSNIMASFGGNADAYSRYMMINKGTYVSLAAENAKAISGLQPRIVHWNTSSTGSPINDVIKMIPPLDTIHNQTGISPPQWLVSMDKKKDE